MCVVITKMSTPFPESKKMKFVFTSSQSVNPKENYQRLIGARVEINQLNKKYGLKGVATLPHTIMLQDDPEFMGILTGKTTGVINGTWIDVNSAEYQGKNSQGDQIYAVLHGVGPLSTFEGLKINMFNNGIINSFGFMKIPNFNEVVLNLIFGKDYESLTITDLKKGANPTTSKPFITWAYVNKDNLKYFNKNEFTRKESAACDVLTIRTGSENLKQKYLAFNFDTSGKKTIYNGVRFLNVGFNKGVGRLLNRGYDGLSGAYREGVFVGVNKSFYTWEHK